MTTAGLLGNLGTKEPYETILYSLYHVAACTRMLGDLLESERLLRNVLECQVKHCGEEDACTYIYMDELSGVLNDMGPHDEATSMLEKCHKGYVEMYGERHRYTLECRQKCWNYKFMI
jgi:hypothetical protein